MSELGNVTWIIIVISVAGAALGIWLLYDRIKSRSKTDNVRRSMGKSNFMAVGAFFKKWNNTKRGGLRSADGPGCYVIKVFSNPTDDMDSDAIYDIMIGKSEKMYAAVYNEFFANNDQKLYYYYSSKNVYVRFVNGEADKLDELEAELYDEYKDAFARVERKHNSKGGSKGKKSKKKKR